MQAWTAALLAVGLAFVAACSSLREVEDSTGVENVAATASPSPTPSATPTAEPTPVQPQTMYRVTVSTEDGATEEALLTPEDPKPAPPNPDASDHASPTPEALAAPEPPKKSGNFFSNLWLKIFPGKSSDSQATAQPEPTPDVPRLPKPREGLLSRMWHMIFPRKEAPPAALPPQWIGTIKLVHESGGYALIDTQGFIAPPPGEILRSVGGDMETGSLKISADRNPPFFIADIIGGRPQPGDRVYSPTAP